MKREGREGQDKARRGEARHGIRTACGTISPKIVIENVDIKNPVAPDVMSAMRIESCAGRDLEKLECRETGRAERAKRAAA